MFRVRTKHFAVSGGCRLTVKRLFPLLGFCCTLALYGQQATTNPNQPLTTVPRLVRITNTFHPANGLPAAPVEGVTFSVYRDESGGSPLWQETQNVSVDSEGHYTALLGSTQNDGVPLDLFSSSEPRWLGVQFNRPAETEQARVRLASVPYALKASDAETLGGLPASAYLRDPNAVVVSSWDNAASTPASLPSPRLLQPRISTIQGYAPYYSDNTGVNFLASPIFYNTSTGNIGIGTTSPNVLLNFVAPVAGSLFEMDGYSGSTSAGPNPAIATRAARGLPTSPSGVLAGDIIGQVNFRGYGATGFAGSGRVRIVGLAAENYTDTAQGSIMSLQTTAIGTAFPAERVHISDSGLVGIGTGTPAFPLDVVGPINSSNGYCINGSCITSFSGGFSTGGVTSITAGNGLLGGTILTSGTISLNTGNANTWTSPQSFTTNTNFPSGVWNSAGSVGIGTTTPGFPLDVVGTINANNPATSGFAPGVQGNTNSPNGDGVFGSNNAASANFGAGVQGNTNLAGNYGVAGYNGATSGYAVGVQGNNNSTSGAGVRGGTPNAGSVGVQGNNNAASGYAVGVQGNTNSNSGAGVQGNANQAGAVGVNGFNGATTGFAVGVQGSTNSPNGGGVLGSTNQTSGWGVQGSSNAASGGGVGVFAESASPNGIALLAQSQSCGMGGCNIVAGTAALLETATTGTLLQGISGTAGMPNNTGTQVFRIDGLGNANFAGTVTSATGTQTIISTVAGNALLGVNNATSGFSNGVRGVTFSPGGAGVVGVNNNATGGGVAVEGNNNVTSGYAIGVNGNSASPNGVGVQGNGNGQNSFGVVGFNNYNGTMGHAVGTQGASASPNGAGLLGQSMDCTSGSCLLVNGTALELHASINNGGTLIAGYSDVQGNNAFGGNRVFHVNGEGSVSAFSSDDVTAGQPAVGGLNTASSGLGVGVAGLSFSPQGAGIVGLSATCGNNTCNLLNGTGGAFYAANNSGGTAGFLLQGFSAPQGTAFTSATQVFAVDGQGNGTYGGGLQVGGNLTLGGSGGAILNGTGGTLTVSNLNVTGNLSKAMGSFRIDHPLDPENKYLYHSFVESPDMKNIYDGVVVLDDRGEATITLPDWFEALNQEFRYQLTCIGGYAPVYVASEVSGNQFHVAGGKAGLKVSWQLTGIRHDAYAIAHRIQVEVDKPANERGTTLLNAAPAKATGGGQ